MAERSVMAAGEKSASRPGRAAKRVRSKRPGRYHHGDLRQALLDASLLLIEREGTGRGLSLRAAARLAGVSEAAPYRHFADKRALLAAIAEEGFVLLAAMMDGAAEGLWAKPLERFQAMGVAYVEFARRHPAHYRVMFGPQMIDKAAYPSLEKAALAAFSYLRGAVLECLRAGLVRQGDPGELALAAWSVVHGLSSLLADGQVVLMGLSPDESERLAETVTRDLLAGLRVR